MITIDTSGLIALIDSRDPDHQRTSQALADDDGPYFIPAEILGEAGYFIESQFGTEVLDTFLSDLQKGNFIADFSVTRVPRIRALIRRYNDLSLGLVDAAVIACAEEYGGNVLTLDLRDFGPVAREGIIKITP